jgi:hypothetical protein
MKAFLRFLNNEHGGPMIQAGRFVVGCCLCAGWVLGVHFVFDRLGAGEGMQRLILFGGLPALAAVEADWRRRCRKSNASKKGNGTMCPCETARPGAMLLTYALYWLAVVGLSPMLAHVQAGDMAGVVWSAMAGLGAVGLAWGITEALSHDDKMRPGSLLWSIGVLTLGVLALNNGWYGNDAAYHYHFSRAVWLGWMASNAINIWLQLRGRLRLRRRPAGVGTRPGPRRPVVAVQRSRAPRLSRYVRVTETLEESEGGIDAPEIARLLDLLSGERNASPPGSAPELIQHNGKLYIEHDGKLVPLREPDTVPVDRWRP